MSVPPHDDRPGEVESLRLRVHHLCQTVSSKIQRSEQKRNSLIAVGVFFAIVCFVSLSLVTSMAFRLDAQALTQIGRWEVERNLPDSRRAMKRYLEARAPEITAHILGALVGALPHLRPVLLRQTEENLQHITRDFEEQLVLLTESSVKTGKSDLDANFPDMSDAEKFEVLTSTVASDFNANMEALMRELYPQYSQEMQRVERYLTGLRAKDQSQLTPKERAEKELIETLLRLMAREHGGTGI